jgi:integrase
MPVDEVKPRHLNRMKDDIFEKGCGPSVVISVLWLASGVFRKAMRDEYRGDNPVRAVESPDYQRQPDHVTWMSPEEVDAVIDAVPDDAYGRIESPLYRTGQQTGLRRGELLALRWKHCGEEWFYISENYVEGEFKRPKGKESRSVPMTPMEKLTLLSWRAESNFPNDEGLVFADQRTGDPLDPGRTSMRFKQAILRARVGPIQLRSTRESAKARARPTSSSANLRCSNFTTYATRSAPFRW